MITGFKYFIPFSQFLEEVRGLEVFNNQNEPLDWYEIYHFYHVQTKQQLLNHPNLRVII